MISQNSNFWLKASILSRKLIASSKTFLSETDFKKSPGYDGEEHRTLVQFDAITLVYAKAPVVWPIVDFEPLVQMSMQWKRQTIS